MSERVSRFESLARSGRFVVTAEVVAPRAGDGAAVTEQARALVGYADAVNVTDNSRASAHMSATAGAAFVAAAGIEPIVQLTIRDRNRLALTAELLGAWALGARNLLCLTGDPMKTGDQPEASEVHDVDVFGLLELAGLVRRTGALPNGVEVEAAPRYFLGVADNPLAEPYDPSRLDAKLDAGAAFVQTQIAYDVEALSAWADIVRARGVFERATVIVGVAPLRNARQARFLADRVPGVSVPVRLIQALEEAGPEAETEGRHQTIEVVRALRRVPGLGGVHLVGMGHEEAVRAVVEGADLLPRPVPTA